MYILGTSIIATITKKQLSTSEVIDGSFALTFRGARSYYLSYAASNRGI